EAVTLLGGSADGKLRFQLSGDGKRISVTDEEGRFVPSEKILIMLCTDEFSRGNNVILPFDSPKIIDSIATEYGVRAERYTACPFNNGEDEIKRKAEGSLFVNDGIIQGIKLLSILSQNKTTLAQEIASLPDFSSFSRSFTISVPPGAIMSNLPEDFSRCGEGMESKSERGIVNIRPEKKGRRLKITAEAETAEIAQSVCDEITRKISSLALDIKGKQS
ncbi:MAG: hypothetical protein ACI4QV_04240, partial [Acutalibacteraceae bacterium]